MNNQSNSEAVQHHSALLIFVLHLHAPKERKAVQPRHHRAATPNLQRGASFLHIPYCSGVSVQGHTLFDLTMMTMGIKLVLAADSVCSCFLPSSDTLYQRA